MDSSNIMELSKEGLRKQEERFVKFRVSDLKSELPLTKAHLNQAQIQYRKFLASFLTACKPISNIINQLEQQQNSAVTSQTSPMKVLHYYYQHGLGVRPDDTSGELVVSFANWVRVLKFICPENDDSDIDMFADCMELDDFITEESLDQAKRSENKDDLEAILRQKLTDQPQLVSESRAFTDAKAKLKNAEDDVKQAENDVKQAENVVKQAKDDGAERDEIKDLQDKVKEFQDKVKDCRGKLRDQQQEKKEKERELKDGIREKFPEVLKMLGRVTSDLRNVYRRVVLNGGADGCETALSTMKVFFGSSVTTYCATSERVCNSYSIKDA